MPLIPETTVPILLVEQTVEYKVYQHFSSNTGIPFFSKILWFEISKLKYWEKTYWKRASVVGAVSEDDKKEMLAVDPDLNIQIIPNAAGEDLVKLYDPKKIIMKPNFLFTGNYTWIQNVEAAELLAKKVFPMIRESLPEAHCYIVGQHAKEKISHLMGENLHVVDIAAADVKSMHGMFKKCSVFISTLEGPGGTRLKILGAMASGLPVISSATGLGGLNVVDGVHAFRANSPEDFARIAKKLYDNPRLYQRIRAAARMLVEKEYDWTRIAAQLEKVYKTLVKKGRS
ncbi:MAG: D-inositol-3-phosphate glycosyltransferase [Microgenomates bacterium OLB22]|nr:MAG: D-inositol-3-phosphate glycosyltransferase [Microgenomates bacterium OLB22]